MKNPSQTLLIVAALAWGLPANAGQNVGNGGDLVCRVQVGEHFRSLLGCQLLDFLEWGMEAQVDVEYQRGDLVVADFSDYYADQDSLAPDFAYMEFSKTLSDAAINGPVRAVPNHFNELRSYRRTPTKELNQAQRARVLKIPAARKELYENLARATPYFRCDKSKKTYSCARAVLVVNKIDEISSVDPALARKIEDEIKTLRWIVVDAQLADVRDESSVIETRPDSELGQGLHTAPRQGAVRSRQIVRLEREALSNTLISHAAGLVFHEVIYKMTVDQGDEDSSRAREIVSLLFNGDLDLNTRVSLASELYEKAN